MSVNELEGKGGAEGGLGGLDSRLRAWDQSTNAAQKKKEECEIVACLGNKAT